MNFAHFFVNRPIFAAVLSIVLVLIGGIAYTQLPVAQYPEIAPPIINVTGQYPGANAQVVASTVVAPIEEQINGVEGMLYISSNATADGRFSIGNVPAGTYVLHVWHERAPAQTATITVGAGGVGALKYQLDARNYKYVQHKNKNGKDYAANGEIY